MPDDVPSFDDFERLYGDPAHPATDPRTGAAVAERPPAPRDRFDEIDAVYGPDAPPGGVQAPRAPGAPRDRYAELEALYGDGAPATTPTFEDFERMYGSGPGPVAPGGGPAVDVRVAGPGPGPRAALLPRDTGPDVVPAVTDLSRWRDGAPPVEADPLGSMLAGARLSPGLTAAIRSVHPTPVVPARDDGRTFTPAHVHPGARAVVAPSGRDF